MDEERDLVSFSEELICLFKGCLLLSLLLSPPAECCCCCGCCCWLGEVEDDEDEPVMFLRKLFRVLVWLSEVGASCAMM